MEAAAFAFAGAAGGALFVLAGAATLARPQPSPWARWAALSAGVQLTSFGIGRWVDRLGADEPVRIVIAAHLVALVATVVFATVAAGRLRSAVRPGWSRVLVAAAVAALILEAAILAFVVEPPTA